MRDLRASFAAALFGIAAHAAPANAAAAPRNWDVERVPVTVDQSLLRLGDDAVDRLMLAAEAWHGASSALPRMTFGIGDADGIGYFPGRKNQNTVRFAKHGEPRARGTLAITVVTADAATGRIVDADVIVNGDYRFEDCDRDGHRHGDGPRGDSRQHDVYDLQSVLTHELGHFVGLDDDVADVEATMYLRTSPRDVRKRDLARSDVQAVNEVYSSDDQTTAGCAVAPWSSGGAGWIAGLVVVGGLALVRAARRSRFDGRPLVAAAVLLSPLALSAEAGADTAPDRCTATARVEAASARWDGGLIVTDLRLGKTSCTEAPREVSALGGSADGLVQVVGHAPIPRVGELVQIELRRARGSVELVYVRPARP